MESLPNVYKYQYKYFPPTPIFPMVANPADRLCFRYGGRCSLEPCSHNVMSAAVLGQAENQLRSNFNSVIPWKDTGNAGSIFAKKECACGRHRNNQIGNQLTENFVSGHLARTNVRHGQSYSVRDWNWNTHDLCSGASSVHNAVQLLEDETKKCISEVCKEQLRRSIDTADDLSVRISDIANWTQQLRIEKEQNLKHTYMLENLKHRVLQMIKNIEAPLGITKENLMTRKIRQGVELVHDEVERALLNEVEIFEKRREILVGESERIAEQINRLRDARHEIEIDLEKKVQAKETDERVQRLSTASSHIGSIRIPPPYAMHSSPTSWVQYTQNILQKSQNERNLSKILETEVVKEMRGAAEECTTAWHWTNSAFKSRLADIGGGQGQLEQHIKKLDKDINTLQLNIAEVQRTIASKVPVLHLAQTRLDKRKERPGLELCRDGPMVSLLGEIHVVQRGLDLLTSKDLELRGTLEHLLKTKSTLERDWRLKCNAVTVDSDKCLSLRLANPISPFIEANARSWGNNQIEMDYLPVPAICATTRK